MNNNTHLGDDVSARAMARAMDELAAFEQAAAPDQMAHRIAQASMPRQGLRMVGAASRPVWAMRMRPVFAMAAAVALVACAGLVYMTMNNGTVPAPLANGSQTTQPTVATAAPEIAIAKAKSDVETWLAVGAEMDAILDSTVADLTATASDLEERASTSFAQDTWYTDASL